MASRLALIAVLVVLTACGLWLALAWETPGSASSPSQVEIVVAPAEATDLVPLESEEQDREQRKALTAEPAVSVPIEFTGEPWAPELPGVFWGRLVDRDSGQGLAGAQVDPDGRSGIGPAARTVNAADGTVRADSEGYFQVFLDGEGRRRMRCQPAGYGCIVFVLGEGHSTREDAQELTLSRSASWTVFVLDASDAPMAGVDLVLSAPTYALARPEGQFVSGVREGIRQRATTDSAGRADFEDLPPEVAIEVRASSSEGELHQPEAVVLQVGEVRRDVLRLLGSARVRVRVVDQQGAPLAARELLLLRDERGGAEPDARRELTSSQERDAVKRARTDAAGETAFEGLTPGHWWVGVAPAARDRGRSSRIFAAILEGTTDGELERAVVPLARPFEVEPGTNELELELVAHRGRFISGIVVGTGDESAHVTVRATTKLYQASLRADVDGEGRFVLGPLMEGEYELTAGTRSGGRRAAGAAARAGDRDVRLELLEGGGFSGRIVDAASGLPAPGAVVVWSPPPRFHLSMSFSNDARSEFEQAGLSPATYDVTGRTPDGRIGTLRGIEVRRGETTPDLELRVRPGGRLRVRYFGPSTYANFHVFDGASVVAGNGLHRGTSDLVIAPAGRVRVELDARVAGQHEKYVDVPLGAEVEVVFDLR